MLELIQYLVENPDVLTLLQEGKVSLLNVSPVEQVAITEAFQNNISPMNIGWR